MQTNKQVPKINGKLPYTLLNREEEDENKGNAMLYYKRGYVNAVARLNHMEVYNDDIKRTGLIIIAILATVFISLSAFICLTK